MNSKPQMNPKDCSVVITNIKDNEIVNYSLLLLKGYVCNVSTENKINLFHKVNKTAKVTNWPLNERYFKCIVSLQKGINKITLKYLQFSRSLNISYKPMETKYCVLPVYIICNGHDGCFQAPKNCKNTFESARSRIAVGAKLIQTIFAEKLHELKLNRKTFQLENEINSEIDECVVFKSKLDMTTARQMSELELWKYFGRELMMSNLASAARKYLAFISCTRYDGDRFEASEQLTHDRIVESTAAHAALGGGGLAIFGSACLHTWPENTDQIVDAFINDTVIDKSHLMDDSCYRGTYGACFTTTLGSVCHELGHTFDLGHTRGGIMGRGFDNVDLIFTTKDVANKNKTDKAICVRPVLSSVTVVPVTKNIEMSPSAIDSKSDESNNFVKSVTYCVNSSQSVQYTEDDEYSTDCKDLDLTYFTRNCGLILYYHRWFNANDCDHFLTYNSTNREISSGAGIRIIEIRNEITEMITDWWEFPGINRRYKFTIPDTALKCNGCIVFVEDNFGKILKEHIL